MEGYNSIDRQALLSHLNDVRVLELTKYKLTTELSNNTNIINHLGYGTVFSKPNVLKKTVLNSALTFIICVGIIISVTFFIRMPDVLMHLLITLFISLAVTFIVGTATAAAGIKKLNAYKRNINADECRIANELKQKQSLVQRNEKLNHELLELNKILAQNYSINIIPSQFRNVEGVCYLYDYLSTSRESFQLALINFNMNRLNINMQQMIRMQGEMLIQQYVTNARLADVKNQNSAMLSRLSAIEQNTELAAKYAAMNEMNTRTISFFKTYEFLRQS